MITQTNNYLAWDTYNTIFVYCLLIAVSFIAHKFRNQSPSSVITIGLILFQLKVVRKHHLYFWPVWLEIVIVCMHLHIASRDIIFVLFAKSKGAFATHVLNKLALGVLHACKHKQLTNHQMIEGRACIWLYVLFYCALTTDLHNWNLSGSRKQENRTLNLPTELDFDPWTCYFFSRLLSIYTV